MPTKEVMTVSNYYASKVVSIALGEVGYLEKKSNSKLTDKTANAGSNNYTKYADDFDRKYPKFYNGKKQTAAWCDIFVDWCLVKAFGEAAALKLLCQPEKSCGAGCSFSAQYYKNNGRFFNIPKVGDQIFFKDGSGSPCHTGIVYKVDATTVYTVEGNTSAAAGVVANGGTVAKKQYALTYNRIYGYGRPKYDAEPAAAKKAYSGTYPTLPARTYFKRGDSGKQVKLLQQFLNWYGSFALVVDGEYGPKTESAVKEFQRKEKITVDGEFGKVSLATAKKVKK